MSEPAPPQYLVRDPQGSVYGPADAAMLRDWVKQGRIVAGMHLAAAGTQAWVEASQHPAVADLLAPGAAPTSPASPPVGGTLSGAPSSAPIAAYPVPAGGSLPYQPMYQAPVPRNPLAQWALITGIAAVLGGCLCTPIGLVAGVAAIILGVMGLNKIKADPALPGRGQAMAGIVLGIVGLVVMVLVVIVALIYLANQPS